MRNKYHGDDLQARLGGTIIRHKGHPYIAQVNSGSVIDLMDIVTGQLICRVDHDDRDLDISSLTLGYVNVEDPGHKLAVYLKREALRQFRQGVDIGRLTQFVLRQGVPQVTPKVLYCQGFVDCVTGKYPTVSEAHSKIVNKGFFSVAVSRNVALKKDGDLIKVFVKDDEVGYMQWNMVKIVKVPKTDTSRYAMFFLNEVEGWKVVEGIK